MEFEVLVLVWKIQVFWDMTSCQLVNSHFSHLSDIQKHFNIEFHEMPLLF